MLVMCQILTAALNYSIILVKLLIKFKFMLIIFMANTIVKLDMTETVDSLAIWVKLVEHVSVVLSQKSDYVVRLKSGAFFEFFFSHIVFLNRQVPFCEILLYRFSRIWQISFGRIFWVLKFFYLNAVRIGKRQDVFPIRRNMLTNK